MNALLTFDWPFSGIVVERLGWVLVQSLWQFALVALLARVTVGAMRQASAVTRYGVLVAAMGVTAALPVATWFFQTDVPPLSSASSGSAQTEETGFGPIDPNQHVGSHADSVEMSEAALLPGNSDARELSERAAVPPANATEAFLPPPSWPDRITAILRPWLAWIVAGWSLGVVLCAARPLLGWRTLRRLRRVGTSPVSDEVLAALRRLSAQLGLRRAVRVLQSTLTRVPVVIGYFRPVILLPVSLMTTIPAVQLEAILAHELAHVRRHDFAVNLLQTLVETLCFYHPAIWWLSHRIRIEREHCCDDLVVELLGNHVEYGRALIAVEELRGRKAILAMGVADGSLLARVRRIAGLHTDVVVGSPWPAFCLIACFMGVALGLGALGWHSSETDVATEVEGGEAARDDAAESRDPHRNYEIVSKLKSLSSTCITDVDSAFRSQQFRSAKEMVKLAQAGINDPIRPVGERRLTQDVRTLEIWRANEDSMKLIGELSSIEQLRFVASDLRGQFGKLDRLKRLRKLSGVNSKFGFDELTQLAQHPSLEEIDVMLDVYGESEEALISQLGNLSIDEQAWFDSWLATRPNKPRYRQHGRIKLLTDRALRQIGKLKHLRVLKVSNTTASGRGFATLRELKHIEELDIGFAMFDADAARTLAQLPRVRLFRSADVTDEALAELANHPALEELTFWGRDVTDAGARSLSQIKTLRRLTLRGSKITDAGLDALSELPDLNFLELRYGARDLTGAALKRFRQRHPDCALGLNKTDESLPADPARLTRPVVAKLPDGSEADMVGETKNASLVKEGFPLPNPEDVRGLDLSQTNVRRGSEAEKETPELYNPDPANPGSWKHPKHVFSMPLAEHTWLQYPAGSGHFYIEHRSDGTPENEQLYGPIAGDPFEVLKLDDLIHERMKTIGPFSDSRFWSSLMFATGNADLIRRAWNYIGPELKELGVDFDAAADDPQRKATGLNRDKNLYDRLACLERAREALRSEAEAFRKPELADVTAQMRDAVAKAEQAIDALNDSVPDATYESVTYRQSAMPSKIPDALWGKPVDGLRLALVPPGGLMPDSVTTASGQELDYNLVVENVSDREIKLSGCIQGASSGGFPEITHFDGSPFPTRFIRIAEYPVRRHWRLKPGERQLISMPSVYFLSEGNESSKGTIGYLAQARAGDYTIRGGVSFGDLDTGRHRYVPGKSEWIGKLMTGWQRIHFVVPGDEPARLDVRNADGSAAIFNTVVQANIGYSSLSQRPWTGRARPDGSVSLQTLPAGKHWLLAASSHEYRTLFQVTSPPQPRHLERRVRAARKWPEEDIDITSVVNAGPGGEETIEVVIRNRTNGALRVSEEDLCLLMKVEGEHFVRILSPRWRTAEREPFPQTTIDAGQTGRLRLNWTEWVREAVWASRQNEPIDEFERPTREPGKRWLTVRLGNLGCPEIAVTDPAISVSGPDRKMTQTDHSGEVRKDEPIDTSSEPERNEPKEKLRSNERRRPETPAEPVAKELELFQGEWTFKDCFSKTWRVTQDEVRKWRWTIKGDQIIWAGPGGEVWKLSFTIDPTKSPKQLDLTFLDGPHKGEKCASIYTTEREEQPIWLCLHDPGAGTERPTDFLHYRDGGQSLFILSPVKPNPLEKELASLQGTWTMDIIQTDGWPKPVGKGVYRNGPGDDLQWVVKESEISWTMPGGEEVKAAFTIDPTKSPKHFDLTFLSGPGKGKRYFGVYERGGLGGKTLWLCLLDSGSSADRPTDISHSTNDGRTLIGLVRANAAK